MHWKNTFLLASTIFLLSDLSLAKDNNKVNEVEFIAQELAAGLYMLEGKGTFTGGNIALSTGKDGVVMIDDSMPPFLDILKEKIKSVAKRDVDFLINTHIHGDHIGNNSAFANEGARILAHENMRSNMERNGIRINGKMETAPKAALPVMTFSRSMNFHLNGENAHIFHLPKAHTDGDSVIHFTRANVIHTGDIFFKDRFPFIDVNNGGSALGYIAAQKKIIKKADANTKIIPGHGSLSTRGDLEKSVAMLEDVVSLIQPHVTSGKSEDDVVKANPIKKYESLSWGFITTEKMIRQVYKSLKNQKEVMSDRVKHSKHGKNDHKRH